MLINYAAPEIKELEASWGARLSAMDLTGVDNYPDSCDKELLPYLAAAYECDISGLPEPNARALLADALRRHFAAGTVGAMKRLLRTISEQAVLLQWYEYDAKPHHFKVQLRPGRAGEKAAVLDVAVLEKYKKLIELTKNAHSVFDGIESAMNDFAMQLGIACAMVQIRHFERPSALRYGEQSQRIEIGCAGAIDAKFHNEIKKEKSATAAVELGAGASVWLKVARELKREQAADAPLQLGRAACMWLIIDERRFNE